VVEAQHVVSTMALVDTLGEQALLEQVLDDSKPSVPHACITCCSRRSATVRPTRMARAFAPRA
jgi:hypothetical protein